MKLFLLTSLSILPFFSLYSQTLSWKKSPLENKNFVENIGQYEIVTSSFFNNEVKFSFDAENEDYFFTPSGVLLKFQDIEKGEKTTEEKQLRSLRKIKGFLSHEEFIKFELEGQKIKIHRDQIECQWIDANPNVEIIGEEKNEFYQNYSVRNNSSELAKSYSYISSFKRIVYKNLYPQIDVVYELHQMSGLKYSIIVHPGGDLSRVKLRYSKDIALSLDGSIHTKTKFGEIIDHIPFSFYLGDDKKEIKSAYKVSGNIITFEIENYDSSRTIVIDPWTQAPVFNTNWDCVWECEKDAAGNVYVIGGVLPMQLLKYNSAGALQWTYVTPYDTTSWLGSFVVDDIGNSYVSLGSLGKLQKIDNTGAMAWDNPSPVGSTSLTEFWSLTLSCDQSELFIGGTSGSTVPEPNIFKIDISNGNISNSLKIHESGGIMNVQEVRSLITCENEKLYFLSQDSIGFVNQSLTSCNDSSIPFNFENDINLGYKCENFRTNNSGINALAQYDNFIYLHRGNSLQKRDFYTSAIMDSVVIPGGVLIIETNGDRALGCSGIDIDDCGNIYVGSINGVYKFDQNLNQIANYPIAFNVYDLEVNSNGEIVVVGSTGTSTTSSRIGTIQSISTLACAPVAMDCCNPSICNPGSICMTDGIFNFSNWVAGGTWAASCGTCINSITGEFDPNFSGQGQFTIYYQLLCGSDSLTINVYECIPLSACAENNGDITVNGGESPFEWYEFLPLSNSPITNQTECLNCDPNYSWISTSCYDGAAFISNCVNPTGYYYFDSGTTVTPGSNYPIKIIDAIGSELIINDISDLPSCLCASFSIDTFNIVNIDCYNDSTGSISVLPSGGVAPYDFSLELNSNLILTYFDSTGTQTFSNLPAGLYTLVVSDSNSCSQSIILTLTEPTEIEISSTVIDESLGSDGSINVTVTGGELPYLFDWSTDGQGDFDDMEDPSGLISNIYYLTVMDNNGCLDTHSVFVGTNVGIQENSSLFDVKVFPNPNDGNFTIKLNNLNEDFEFELFDIAGKLVMTKQIILNTNKNIEITGIKPGSYSIVFNSKLGIKVVRIVVI